MLVKAIGKFFLMLIVGVMDVILKIIYLSMPLWFFMLVLQLRKNVDKVTGLTIYYDEDSTWHTVYDGVVLVNTNPGGLYRKINSIKQWFINTRWYWLILCSLSIIGALCVIAYKIH